MRTRDYLSALGVPELPPRTCPFDPGYDPGTLEGHLEQSAHLMAELKISMACWLVADEGATRRKVAAARAHGVPTVTGGGPFEIAVAQGALPDYLDLCADVGMSKIECGRGFTDMPLGPEEVVGAARERGLGVEVELGSKHAGAFGAAEVESRSIGRSTSGRGAICAGLLVRWKPYGALPPSSPTSSGLSSRAASGTAVSSDGTGKQRRPEVTALTAVVVARMTSTATIVCVAA